MPCHGSSVRDVATDATGYAAITERFVVLGDLAGAPDLPLKIRGSALRRALLLITLRPS